MLSVWPRVVAILYELLLVTCSSPLFERFQTSAVGKHYRAQSLVLFPCRPFFWPVDLTQLLNYLILLYNSQWEQIDCEQLRSSINFWPCRPSSAVYKISYAADEGLHVWNILHSVVNWHCYVTAHNQFAHIEECSNEPLQLNNSHFTPSLVKCTIWVKMFWFSLCSHAQCQNTFENAHKHFWHDQISPYLSILHEIGYNESKFDMNIKPYYWGLPKLWNQSKIQKKLLKFTQVTMSVIDTWYTVVITTPKVA